MSYLSIVILSHDLPCGLKLQRLCVLSDEGPAPAKAKGSDAAMRERIIRRAALEFEVGREKKQSFFIYLFIHIQILSFPLFFII